MYSTRPLHLPRTTPLLASLSYRPFLERSDTDGSAHKDPSIIAVSPLEIRIVFVSTLFRTPQLIAPPDIMGWTQGLSILDDDETGLSLYFPSRCLPRRGVQWAFTLVGDRGCHAEYLYSRAVRRWPSNSVIENTSPGLVGGPVSSSFGTIPHMGSELWGLWKTVLVSREDIRGPRPRSHRSRAQDLPLWFADLSLDNWWFASALPNTTSHGMAWVRDTFSATVLGNLIHLSLMFALISSLQTFQETVHEK